MAGQETHVVYKAIANFSELNKKLGTTKQKIEAVKKAEQELNKSSVAGEKKLQAGRKETIRQLGVINAQLRAQKGHLRDIASLEKNLAQGGAKNARVKGVQEYTNLNNKIREAKKLLKELTEQEQSSNASLANSRKNAASAIDDEVHAFEDAANAAGKHAKAQEALNDASTKGAKAQNALSKGLKATSNASKDVAVTTERWRRSLRGTLSDASKGPPTFNRLTGGLDKFNRGLRRVSNWRPRIMPPFIALVPIIGAVVAAINPLVAVMGAAGGVAIGFANSLGVLAGAALALPGIFSAVAAGISSMVGAMGGIGGVFAAHRAAQRGGGGGGGGGGTGQSEADRAREIARANEDLKWAKIDLGRAYEDAAEDITDAEEALRDAQDESRRAQEDLNEARRDALRDLQDLRREVERGSLSEERALADLQLAKERYNNVMADPGSSEGDKLDALADVKEAEAALADVRLDNIRNQEDLVEAEKKGVEGSDAVVDAKERLSDSIEAESDARRELVRTRQDESRKIAMAIREVEDAEKRLRDAQKGTGGGGGGGGGGLDEFNRLLNELSPSARKVVLALIAMGAAWKEMRRGVQEKFFSQIVDDMEELESLIPVVGQIWGAAASSMGAFFSGLINMFASPEWKRDFATIAVDNAANLDNMGNSVLYLLDGLRHLMIAAGPFTQMVTNGWKEGAENLRDMLAAGRADGSLADYLERVYEKMQQWWRIVKNVGKTLFNYGDAASEFGDWLTDGFEETTRGWLQASSEATTKNSPFKKWLEDIKPLVSEMKNTIGAFFGWMATVASDEGNIAKATRLLETIRTETGPAIAEFLQTLTDSDIAQGLLDALTSIIESLDTIMKNGGADGLKNFFKIVEDAFAFIADLSQSGVGAWFISMLVPAIGVLAGLTFVGKFTGLFALFGWLLKIGKSGGMIGGALRGIGAGLAGLGAGMFAGATGGAVPAAKGGVVAAGKGGAAAKPAGGVAGKMPAVGAAVGKAIGPAFMALIGLEVANGIASAFNTTKTNPLDNSKTFSGGRGAQAEFDRVAQQGANGGFRGNTESLIPTGGGDRGSILTKRTGANGFVEDNISPWLGPLGDFASQLSGLDQAQQSVQQVDDAMAEMVSNGNTAAAKAEFDKWVQAGKDAGISLGDVKRQFPAYAQALKDAGPVMADTTSKWDTMRGTMSAVLAKQYESIDAGYALQEAKTAEKAALEQLDARLALGKEAWYGNSEAALANRQAVFDYAAQAQNTADQMIKNKVPYDEFKSTLENQKKKLYDSMVQMGMNKGEAKLLADQLIKIPTKGDYELKHNIDKVKQQAKDFKDNYDGKTYTSTFWLNLGYDQKTANEMAAFRASNGQTYTYPSRGGLIEGGGTQYFATGGTVQKASKKRGPLKPRGSDTIAAMLTPGEFVLRKEVVDKLGADALTRLNNGGELSDLILGKGLLPQPAVSPLVGSSGSAMSSGSTTQHFDYSMKFGDIILQGTSRDTDSTALPRVIRNLSYLGARRGK